MNLKEQLGLDDFTYGYLLCALWSTNDESDERGGVPIDENYGIEDIQPESLAKAKEDCRLFQEKNAEDLKHGPITHHGASAEEYAGHDFWLSRNGHGSGFFDGDWPEEVGDRLREAAEATGEVYLYVGDDGTIDGF